MDATPTGQELGDTFGVVGAILSGFALIGVAASLHDMEKAREESDRQIQKQQDQIDALAAITRAITDPAVVARVELTDDSTYKLIIENIGRRIAYDLRFDVEPKAGLYFGEGSHRNLADLPLVCDGLPMMAPGQRIAVLVGSGKANEEKRSKGEPYVADMTLKIAYYLDSQNVQPRRFEEFEYAFSFDAQQHTIQPRGEVAVELNRIYKLLQKR